MRFLDWAYEIVEDIVVSKKSAKKNERRKVVDYIKIYAKALFFSFLVLLLANVPLTIMMTAITIVEPSVINTVELFLILYISEMLIIFLEILKRGENKQKEKISQREIAFKVLGVFVAVFFILIELFYMGANSIENKTTVSLLENENYMISYNDGERYVLHKVDYNDGEIVIYRNEQKIVKIDNYEISIKPIEKIQISD